MNNFETFTYLILKCSKLIQKIKNREIKKYGLKAIHVMCIYQLYYNPSGLTHNDLVYLTLEDKSAISRVVKDLCKKGLTEVEVNKNKYNSVIKLTKQGQEFGKYEVEIIKNIFASCSLNLTDKEREIFYLTLSRVTDNLEKYSQRKI